MKLTADRDGNTRYFSAKLGFKEQFDPKEIEMLTVGAVPMLVPPLSVRGKKNNVIQFDISSYSTLEFYISCILSREQFAELMIQCIDVFRRIQQVYMNYKNLVLDLNKVYIQLSDRTVHFIYLPLMNSKREGSIPDFFRTVIGKASRSTYEQASFLDSCLMWLERSSFILDEFEGFIKEQAFSVGTSVAAAAPVMASGWQPPVQKIQPAVPQTVQPDRTYKPAPKDSWSDSMPTTAMNSGEMRIGEQIGGTVLLGVDEPPAPKIRYYLLRVATDEKIELAQFPFLVGTELGSVNYCVAGNATVSRRHAEFSLQDTTCVIIDQKSTNKTYVNDCALVPFIGQALMNGDVLRLANERFVFVQEE